MHFKIYIWLPLIVMWNITDSSTTIQQPFFYFLMYRFIFIYTYYIYLSTIMSLPFS